MKSVCTHKYADVRRPDSKSVFDMRVSQPCSDPETDVLLGGDAAHLLLLRSGMPGRAMAIVAIAFGLGAMVTAISASDDAKYLEPITFSIPSQPLALALQAYSAVTGAQLLYESSAANGRMSTSVEGILPRDTALRILLTDTDLAARYTRANSITLAPASADADDPPVAVFAKADMSLETLRVHGPVDRGDPAQLRAYTGVIQSDIQRALKKDDRTRNGTYSAGVKLWIDGPRTVKRTELFRSSGDLDRDDVISRLLDGLQISQAPPANTPQPVLIMITVRSM
jgi:hypothetical protein